MYYLPSTGSARLGQPLLIPESKESSEWQAWLRHGLNLITGQAQLQTPQVVFTGAEASGAGEILKNPIVWIGLAGLTIALVGLYRK